MKKNPFLLKELKFASRQYFEYLDYRYLYLRKPLNLHFNIDSLRNEANEHHFVLLGQESKIFAGCSLKPINKKRVKLRQMFVFDSERGKGFGAELINMVEDLCEKRGYKEVELNARHEKRGFYLKNNYKPISDEFIEVGIAHIKMLKVII